MKIKTKIKKWGNSLGLRLSGPLKSIPHFEENMTVDVEITEKGIHVSPARKKRPLTLPFTEAELLEGLDAYTAHTDEALDFKILPEEDDDI